MKEARSNAEYSISLCASYYQTIQLIFLIKKRAEIGSLFIIYSAAGLFASQPSLMHSLVVAS